MRLAVTTLWVVVAVVAVVVEGRPQLSPVPDIASAYQAYHHLWLAEAQRNANAPFSYRQILTRPRVIKKVAAPKPAPAPPAAEQQAQEQLKAEQQVQEQPTPAAEKPTQSQLTAEEQTKAEPIVEKQAQEKVALREPVQDQPTAEQQTPDQMPMQEQIQGELTAQQHTKDQVVVEEQAQNQVTVEKPEAGQQIQEQLTTKKQTEEQPVKQKAQAAKPQSQQVATVKALTPTQSHISYAPPATNLHTAFENFFDLWNAEAIRNSKPPVATPIPPLWSHVPEVVKKPEPAKLSEPPVEAATLQPKVDTLTQVSPAPRAATKAPVNTSWLSVGSPAGGQQGHSPVIILLHQPAVVPQPTA